MLFQDTLQLDKHSRGAYEITELIAGVIKESRIHEGTCHLFIHSSTSALILCDTADENTKSSTADFMAELAPSSINAGKEIETEMEGLQENIRGACLQNEITIPVSNSRPGIGVWQGIFFWEEKVSLVERKLTVTIMGEPLHKSFRLTRT
jgi:secondary thiamine-phosphate synthase enzyme